MSKRLSDEDRRAVDFLLDRSDAQQGDGNGGSGTAGAATEDGEFAQRIGRVEDLLQMLDHLPAPEPSANLASRVFARIEEAGIQEAAMRQPGAAAHPIGIRPTA